MQINFEYLSNSSLDSDCNLPESLQEKIDYEKSDLPFLNNQYKDFCLELDKEQQN